MGDFAEDLLAPERLAGEGNFDPVPIRRAWGQHLSGRRNFMGTLASPKEAQHWSLTTLREKLVKIGAK
ncbi:MAG: hypothetical protein O2967_18730 [Proteobacteria bacterium]|nr:hypothetical protein [Pseudomonadota bacterium]